MARIFVCLVGVLYVLLGVYCSLLPARASKAVGFELAPGSGQSEFLTVYGGLEIGMGLVFLLPLLRPAETEFALRACLMIHGCLVLFRSIGFLMYRNFASTTYNLAIGEWILFLGSAILWWRLTKT
jgi:hypothetical protein